MYARANGLFEAKLNTRENNVVQVSELNVTTDYTNNAEASILVPKYGVTVDNAELNLAYARTGAVANACITGSGKIHVSGDVTVKADGKTKAVANMSGTDATIFTRRQNQSLS